MSQKGEPILKQRHLGVCFYRLSSTLRQVLGAVFFPKAVLTFREHPPFYCMLIQLPCLPRAGHSAKPSMQRALSLIGWPVLSTTGRQTVLPKTHLPF